MVGDMSETKGKWRECVDMVVCTAAACRAAHGEPNVDGRALVFYKKRNATDDLSHF